MLSVLIANTVTFPWMITRKAFGIVLWLLPSDGALKVGAGPYPLEFKIKYVECW